MHIKFFFKKKSKDCPLIVTKVTLQKPGNHFGDDQMLFVGADDKRNRLGDRAVLEATQLALGAPERLELGDGIFL